MDNRVYVDGTEKLLAYLFSSLYSNPANAWKIVEQPYIFLMYVPLWVGITFVWMDALWREEPLRPEQYCKYCAAELGVDAVLCERRGKKVHNLPDQSVG